jgi:phosphomethylpyrimidine synthase
MTLKEEANKGKENVIFKRVAEEEGIEEEVLVNSVKEGKIVVLYNPLREKRGIKLKSIGERCRVKVNVNVGLSPNFPEMWQEEVKKAKLAVESGADTIMDLSCGGDIDRLRLELLNTLDVPIGTVPIYQAAEEGKRKYGSLLKMKEEEMIEMIERHAKDGVEFVTIHAGLTLDLLDEIKGRQIGIVSRGGSILAEWMSFNKRENPLYLYFDEILDLAAKYNLVLSLGDGLRPGSIKDASDKAQIGELYKIGELVKRAWDKNVSVIVEGPGHIPISQIEFNIKLAKEVCLGAPFYVLGPLVTDIAIGYDHIAAAIGGALAGYYGADFLCAVTPTEHLGLPSLKDIKEGTYATIIAAHAADLARGKESALKRDFMLSDARAKFDWKKQIELSLNPLIAKELICKKYNLVEAGCTMCGKEFCAILRSKNIL